jgi:hypothetical protein
MCRHVRRLTPSFSPLISIEIFKMKNKINFYIWQSKLVFHVPCPFFLKIGKRFFLDECTTEMRIHLLNIFFKIPIRKRIRGEFIFPISRSPAFCKFGNQNCFFVCKATWSRSSGRTLPASRGTIESGRVGPDDRSHGSARGGEGLQHTVNTS